MPLHNKKSEEFNDKDHEILGLQMEKMMDKKINQSENRISENIQKMEMDLKKFITDKLNEHREKIKMQIEQTVEKALNNQGDQCRDIFVRKDEFSGLFDATKTQREHASMSLAAAKGNLVVSIVRIIAWIFIVIGFIVLVLLKTGLLNIGGQVHSVPETQLMHEKIIMEETMEKELIEPH